MGCFLVKQQKKSYKPTVEDSVIFLKTVIKIQRWYRLRKLQMKLRECADWEIFKKLNSAQEQDRALLQRFFNALITFHKMHDPEYNKRRISKNISIVLPSTSIDCSNVAVDLRLFRKYIGPDIQYPVTKEHIESLINFFSNKKNVLHPGIACGILHRAAERLKNLPNINLATTGIARHITVVGNVHGSWDDLLTIFYKNYLPSISNPYIFNGGLVDRGASGIEVLLIILACFLAYPRCVFLNRGSHEDPELNSQYGFIDEIEKKYGHSCKDVYSKIQEVYRWMPLATIVNNRIFVVHGGITDRIRFKLVHTLRRSDYISVVRPPTITSSDHEFQWFQILDLLWSDPSNKYGCQKNANGRGLTFGPNITESFLTRYKLDYLIRSHECKREGHELTHDGRVATVFSCSNFFAMGSNRGAYLKVDSTSKFNAFQFSSGPKKLRNATLPVKVDQIERSLIKELCTRLAKNVNELQAAFEARDPTHSGLIPLNEWCECMRSITAMQLPWPYIAQKLDKDAPVDRGGVSRLINYNRTLRMIRSQSIVRNIAETDINLSDHVYEDRAILQHLFQVVDEDGDGFITPDELYRMFKKIRDFMEDVTDNEMRRIFELLDFNNDRKIGLNEFLEGFRLCKPVLHYDRKYSVSN